MFLIVIIYLLSTVTASGSQECSIDLSKGREDARRLNPPARLGVTEVRLTALGTMHGALLTMLEAAKYSAVETLRNGRSLEIRAFRPEDRADFLSAADRIGPLSLYRRFFTAKRGFTERERTFFLNVDFDKHVALIALVEEAERKVIVAGGRYVVVQPGKAEVAFVVIDQYQGQGIGSLLMRHLAVIARAAGLQELIAEVLPENMPMLKVFERSGLQMNTTPESEIVHVTLQLN